MRDALNRPRFLNEDRTDEILVSRNISFTGNAIDHLSSSQTSINLNDWEWHEEIINGEAHCIITDKLLPKNFRLD